MSDYFLVRLGMIGMLLLSLMKYFPLGSCFVIKTGVAG